TRHRVLAMGYFDDIVPPDGASSYVATPPGVPRITVRPYFETGALRPPQDEGVEPPPGFRNAQTPADASGATNNAAPARTGLFDDIVPPAARAGELARHKATIESALSNTVPLRLQHPRPVEIAVRLMADHGMPLDEALDRATMRFHAEEGTAEAGKISDVIGKDAFDEAQRVAADGGTAEFVGRAASPDLAQPAPGIGQSRTATEAQARPDGEYAPGDSAAQGGGAADGKTIGSEDAAPGEERAQSRDEPASAAAEGQGRAERLTLSDGDAIVENPPHHGTPERLVPLWQPFPIDQNSLGALASAAGRPELAAPVNPSDAAFPDPAPIDPAPRHRRFAPSLGEYGISEDDPSAANLWKLPPGSLIKAVHDFVVYVGDINAGRKHLPQTFDPNVDDPAVDEAIRQAWTAATLSTIGPGAKFRPPRGTIAPVPPRQILEASEQGEAIPRTAPQPPARPPDKAAAQSDRITSEARESGPSDSNALSADVPNSRAGKDLPPSAATEGAKSRIPAEDSIAARADQLAPRDEIGTQPPARPPDNAAARSETMASEARESGPFDSGARRADAPLERADRSLKPRREQKPADDGLSGDGDTQVDLVDVAKSAGAAKARGGAYVLRDRGDAVVRSGRTGNLAAREGQHRRDRALPEHRFDPVYRTDSYLEQRGLEQILHDRYDPPLNKIRPISPSNKNIDTYMNEARKHLREHDEK
ncbi:MAG: hypothetical protein V7604_2728, partial [Hyphomicrobiales bacterium]